MIGMRQTFSTLISSSECRCCNHSNKKHRNPPSCPSSSTQNWSIGGTDICVLLPPMGQIQIIFFYCGHLRWNVFICSSFHDWKNEHLVGHHNLQKNPSQTPDPVYYSFFCERNLNNVCQMSVAYEQSLQVVGPKMPKCIQQHQFELALKTSHCQIWYKLRATCKAVIPP